MIEPDYVLVFARPSSQSPSLPLSDEQVEEILTIAVDYHEIDLKVMDKEKGTFLVHSKDLKLLIEDDSGDFLGLEFEEVVNLLLGFEPLGNHFDARLTAEKVCKLVLKNTGLIIETAKSPSASPSDWKFKCGSQEAFDKLLAWEQFGVMKTYFRFVSIQPVADEPPLNVALFHDSENCFLEKDWGGNASELYDLVLRFVPSLFPPL